METILSTAFGHKAEILNGKANDDQLYKEAQEFTDSLKSGGVTSLFILMALYCELTDKL